MNTEFLKGVNIGGWFSQLDAIAEKDPDDFPGVDAHIKTFIADDDIDRIRKSGLNHVRLPIDFQHFFSAEGETNNTERLDFLEKSVNKIADTGLIVMLDLHECPGHDFDEAIRSEQDYFTDKNKREATKRIWAELCRRFGRNPKIYLELLNEPVANTAEEWNETKAELSNYVRKSSPESTIIIGSNRWNAPSEFDRLEPLDDSNIVYCFHYYSPLLFTHQKADWLADPNTKIVRKYPGEYSIDEKILTDKRLMPETGVWNRDRLAKEIEPVLRFRDKYRVPIVCNEFGVFHQAPRESQLNWLRDFLSILKDHGIGFSYWNYKNLDFGLVSVNEQLHQDLPRFNNPKRLDEELLVILGEF